jgi:hypothetical protein
MAQRGELPRRTLVARRRAVIDPAHRCRALTTDAHHLHQHADRPRRDDQSPRGTSTRAVLDRSAPHRSPPTIDRGHLGPAPAEAAVSDGAVHGTLGPIGAHRTPHPNDVVSIDLAAPQRHLVRSSRGTVGRCRGSSDPDYCRWGCGLPAGAPAHTSLRVATDGVCPGRRFRRRQHPHRIG